MEIEFRVQPGDGAIFGPLAFEGQIGKTIRVNPGMEGVVKSATVASDGQSAVLRVDVWSGR